MLKGVTLVVAQSDWNVFDGGGGVVALAECQLLQGS